MIWKREICVFFFFGKVNAAFGGLSIRNLFKLKPNVAGIYKRKRDLNFKLKLSLNIHPNIFFKEVNLVVAKSEKNKF